MPRNATKVAAVETPSATAVETPSATVGFNRSQVFASLAIVVNGPAKSKSIDTYCTALRTVDAVRDAIDNGPKSDDGPHRWNVSLEGATIPLRRIIAAVFGEKGASITAGTMRKLAKSL